MVEARWRVLLDTNIWISAFINPTAPPARVLDLYTEVLYQLIASQPLLDEISAVLSRPRVRRAVRVSDERIETWLSRLQQEALFVDPEGTLQLCRDPKDDGFWRPLSSAASTMLSPAMTTSRVIST